MTTTLILSIVLFALALVLALWSWRMYYKASRAAKHAKRLVDDAEFYFGNLPDSKTAISKFRIWRESTNVTVYGTLKNANGQDLHAQAIKKFPYNIGDEDDFEFAWRQAEELVEKLEEK